ncbi:MAG: ABC-F family ATP-binding cassette domain-containing protein [Bacillota bacterium]
MPLLTISGLTKMYGSDLILDGLTMQLQPGEKAGLIGPNGSGKTTILKIIAGDLDPDGGAVHLSRGVRTGYLHQEPPPLAEGTLRGYLQDPLRHIFQMKTEITSLEEEIAEHSEKEGNPPQELLERYAEMTTRFEEEGGYQVESRLLGVVKGLGFSEADLERDLSSFSGGEKTRVRLGGLLLCDLDLLLLDEPTNFLDLAALEWLERYLRDLNCALLVVSHDRFFLDRVVSRIFALQKKEVKSYSGNYSAYQKQLEMERLSNVRERQRLERIKAREERLVREAKGDERSQRQAKSRRKHLEKMGSIEVPEKEQSFKLGFGYSGRSGRQVVIFDRVTKTFDTSPVLEELSFEIRFGDRIALVGPNGAGKTTLLKLISGNLAPTAGKIKLGPSVRVTYFSQEQEQLDPQKKLLGTITAASDFDLKQAHNHLGRYLFRGDDVFKQVKDLSGGEKNRLALARLALGSGNCLLMDEPTSHLDLPALEEVESVLKSYPGSMIIVSHDRYFLKGLVNRVFELKSDRLAIYDCSFEEYLNLKEKKRFGPTREKSGKEEEKKRRQMEHRRRQEAQKKRRRLQDEQKQLEEQISAAEQEIAGLEETLADPARYGNHDELAELGARLQEEKEGLNQKMERWEQITAELEAITGAD